MPVLIAIDKCIILLLSLVLSSVHYMTLQVKATALSKQYWQTTFLMTATIPVYTMTNHLLTRFPDHHKVDWKRCLGHLARRRRYKNKQINIFEYQRRLDLNQVELVYG